MVRHDPGVTFDDVACLDTAKQLLHESVTLPLLLPELFTGESQRGLLTRAHVLGAERGGVWREAHANGCMSAWCSDRCEACRQVCEACRQVRVACRQVCGAFRQVCEACRQVCAACRQVRVACRQVCVMQTGEVLRGGQCMQGEHLRTI